MREFKPRFRPDLRQHANEERHGDDVVIIEDPVANKFFRISRYELELLEALDGTVTLDEAREKLRIRGRHFTAEHATKIADQCAKAGLLLGTGYSSGRVQAALRKRMDREARQRSLLKLYYLYLPLINPDNFLQRTVWIWNLLVNRLTAVLFIATIPGAIYLLVAGLSRFQAEYLFFFNIENLLVLWLAIASVKLVHEFSHAYAAKKLGLRVPEMGIAFLIFFPCLYCNTTAAWQLGNRRQRVSIAIAGIAAEGVAAVLGVYVWYFTKPGIVNSVAFYFMAISLVSSFLFNGNPLLKFDGYFVLTDLLHLPNLQTRAFTQIRYLFLNQVLGIASVTGITTDRREHLILLVYGVASMVYRVFLYSAIVAGVYFRFDKTIGVLLGGIIFVLLVMRPLIRGAVSVTMRRSEMSYRPGGLAVFLGICAAVLFVLTRPWSSNSVYPCFVESAEVRQMVIPAEAPVRKISVRQGDRIREGQVLVELDPTRLQYDLKCKETERTLIRREIAQIENGAKDLSRLPLKYIELSQAEDALAKIRIDLANLEWRAPFAGSVVKLHNTVQKGAQPGKGTVIGELANDLKCEILALVPETDVSKVQKGARVKVWFPANSGTTVEATVKEISPFKEEDLESSPFSSRFGGEIATAPRNASQKDAPLEAHYLCRADLPAAYGLPLGMTGRLVVGEQPRSTLKRIMDAAYRTFHREIVF